MPNPEDDFEFPEGDPEIYDFEELDDESKQEILDDDNAIKTERARARAYMAMAKYHRQAGNVGINDIVTQCERILDWQLECVSERSMIDDILLSKYNIYDPHAWLRYRNSWFEKRLRIDIYHLGLMHSTMFAKAVAKSKLNLYGRVILFMREMFWRMTKNMDAKIQKM